MGAAKPPMVEPEGLPRRCWSCRISCCAAPYLSLTSAKRFSWSASRSSASVKASASLDALTFSFIHISFACASNCSRSFSFSSSCSTFSRLDRDDSRSSLSSRSAASSRWLRFAQRTSRASTSREPLLAGGGGGSSKFCEPGTLEARPMAVRAICRSRVPIRSISSWFERPGAPAKSPPPNVSLPPNSPTSGEAPGKAAGARSSGSSKPLLPSSGPVLPKPSALNVAWAANLPNSPLRSSLLGSCSCRCSSP
mmetsp:Transcript_105371/g.187350  ORF Transcript_105371/g.187350 Transcript_105371/m.187350 type:complete len:252 (-) Transcript_105371:103-858(-)